MLHPTTFYDFTIVGAGASGLWLAHALIEHGLLQDKTLCIIEPDRNKDNDRTWCYWAEKPIDPAEMASKQWSSIYQQNISPKPNPITPYHYYHIRSTDFYGAMKHKFTRCKNITWIGEELLAYNEEEDQVSVHTTKHQWKTHRLFLSALPKSMAKTTVQNTKKSDLFLWQSFVGWRVKTTKDTFIEDNMSMMDFSIEQNNQTQFIYELPFSKTEALVEMTRFGKERIPRAEAEKELEKYLMDKGDYTIEEVEIGAIPMTPQFDSHEKHQKPQSKIIFIGTLAGAIKPSTGFGFKRMNEHGNSLAMAIKMNQALPTLYRPFRFRLYDELLLIILAKTPHRGKEIFEQLFRTQPIQRILKFLDEKTTPLEELKIFVRLPIRLFLKSLFYRLLA